MPATTSVPAATGRRALRIRVNVTAFGPGPGFCRLGEIGGPPPWINDVGSLKIRSVDCFDGTGVPTPSDFFVSYTSL